jgi:hypothetical protein
MKRKRTTESSISNACNNAWCSRALIAWITIEGLVDVFWPQPFFGRIKIKRNIIKRNPMYVDLSSSFLLYSDLILYPPLSLSLSLSLYFSLKDSLAPDFSIRTSPEFRLLFFMRRVDIQNLALEKKNLNVLNYI